MDNVMKKGTARFSLLGRACINEKTFTFNSTSDSGYVYNKLNLGVDCGNGNIVYASMMGGTNPQTNLPIYVHGKKDDGKDDFKNRFQIAWEDRNDKELLKSVGESCFIRISVEKDKNGNNVTEKFLSEYDAIEYISQKFNPGDVIRVNGNLEYSVYNDEVRINKHITAIYLNNPETDPDTFSSTFTQTFLLDKNSFDKKLNKEKNTYNVYGYVVDYIGKYDGKSIRQNAAFPITFEIDASKYTNAQLATIIKRWFVGENGWYSELVIEGNLVEGAVIGATSISDLPQEMQDLVNMGLLSETEAIAKMAIKGNREKRMIFLRPLINNEKNENGEFTGTTKIYYEPNKYKTDEVILYNDIIKEYFSDTDTNTSMSSMSSDGDLNIDFLFPNADK